MPEKQKLQQRTIDLTGAYDERKRLFDNLRRLEMDDDERAAAIDEYKAASKHFDDLRAKLDSK